LKRLTGFFLLLIFTFLFASYTLVKKSNNLYDIPLQTIYLFKVLGIEPKDKDQTVKEFQISKFVTYLEYKEYLNAIKLDSTEIYFQTQLPDSNIGIPNIRSKYITSVEYDKYPVLGISWDNAMNFCKWKTLKENKDSIEFIYRLPTLYEWVAAYNYLLKYKIDNDFNINYSDWLLNSKDESVYFHKNDIDNSFFSKYIYLHKISDHRALKRKFVIGNSYLYQIEKLFDYYFFNFYSDEGYRQISFRYIKEPIVSSEIVNKSGKSLAENILDYWNIK